MNPRMIFLVGLSCLTFLESAIAQSGGPWPPMPKVPANLPAMYEDIEIMRRLLNMALLTERGTPSYRVSMVGGQAGSGMARMPQRPPSDNAADMAQAWLSAGLPGIRAIEPRMVQQNGGAEGIYVDGYGVIFGLTLPLEYLKNATGPTKETTGRLSEWDRMQKEVRGDRTDGQDSEPLLRTESPTEKILHALARHGHHFTQLPDNQKLVVAITLRSMEPGPMVLTFTSGGPQWMGGSTAQRGLYDPPPVNQQAIQAMQPKDVERELEAGRVEAKNHAILGDQRIRTVSRTKEAIDAYARAVEMYGRIIQAEKAMRPDPAQMQVDLATFAELYTKLAAANLVLGDSEGASQALQNFAKSVRGAAPRGSAAMANRLPPKLIVSVSKQMVRQVAAHTMTFEEFKSAADVKLLHLNSPTTETRPAKEVGSGGAAIKPKPETGTTDPGVPGSSDLPPDNKPNKP